MDFELPLPDLHYSLTPWPSFPDGREIISIPFYSSDTTVRTVAEAHSVSIHPTRTGEWPPSAVYVTGARLLVSGKVGVTSTVVRVDLQAQQPEWLAALIADASARLGVDLTAPPEVVDQPTQSVDDDQA